jgi:hypothetical protein
MREIPREQRWLSAAQLMAARLPQRAPILDPILSGKSLAMLYGPRGLGKTFVALSIAYAAASGTSFLGWRAPRPHKVIYVDGEMAAIDMRQRLALLGPPPPTLDFLLADLVPSSPPDIATRQGQTWLMENWGRPELVVLDNLSSLAGFRSGDPDDWNDLQRFLMLQRRFGRAMLLVHHANKQGVQRGGNRKEDVLDLVIGMRRPADYAPAEGARLEIHFDKARGLSGDAIEPIEAQLETVGPGIVQWRWQPVAGGPELRRAAGLLNEGRSAEHVAIELGISRAKAFRLRRRALVAGLFKPMEARP